MSETASTPSTTPGQPKKGAGGCLLLVGITGAIIIGWMIFSSSTSSSPNGDDVGAYVACQQWVEEQLKAPSTAEFPTTSSVDISNKGAQWTVNGYVDAQNGFGAMIRTDFTCTATHTGDGNYRGNAYLSSY